MLSHHGGSGEGGHPARCMPLFVMSSESGAHESVWLEFRQWIQGVLRHAKAPTPQAQAGAKLASRRARITAYLSSPHSNGAITERTAESPLLSHHCEAEALEIIAAVHSPCKLVGPRRCRGGLPSQESNILHGTLGHGLPI